MMRPWLSSGIPLLIALLPVAAAASQPQANDASLSPAGAAIYSAFVRNPDPALLRCIGDVQAIGRELVAIGQRPTLDWAAARALIGRQADRQSECVRLAQAQSLALLDRLAPADRARYFRQLYGSAADPALVTTPAGQPR